MPASQPGRQPGRTPEFGADVDFVYPSFREEEGLASLAFADTNPAALFGHAGSR